MATWTLTTPSPEFLAKVKQNEGSMAYQQKKGYFKNGKFWVYSDSLGFPTIGYGLFFASFVYTFVGSRVQSYFEYHQTLNGSWQFLYTKDFGQVF